MKGAPTKWTANDLAASLIAKLQLDRHVVVREVQLFDGPPFCRGDLVAMERRGSGKPRVKVFEIKVGRSDFWADVRADKWRAYRAAGPVYFATPRGLVTKAELPDGAGLIEMTEDRRWLWTRRARPEARDLQGPPIELVRRLVLAAWDQADMRARAEMRPRYFSDYMAAKNARTEFGRKVCALAADLERAERLIAYAEKQHRELNEQRYNGVQWPRLDVAI